MSKFINCLLIALFFNILFFCEIHAATINASSCSSSAVQTAINSANNGDTVVVPAGTCTWTTTVTIPNTKGITLQGAGIDWTVILGSAGIAVTGADGRPFRITGFTFSTGGTQISITGTCKNFRVDHCKFTSGPGVHIDGYTYGVIDHCQFTASSPFTGVWAFGNNRDSGNASWSTPLSLGTADAVYVEDCLFSFDNYQDSIAAIDSRSGGRYVFRYNTVKNEIFANHDACSTQQRGTFSWEIYNNTFTYTRDIGICRAANQRGGTGVIFNNTFTATAFNCGGPLGITNYRSFTSGCQNPWANLCDNNVDRMCSNLMNNCTTDGDCTGGAICINIDGHEDQTGYPCRDQIGRTTNQTLSPVYAWNNTANGAPTNVYVYNAKQHIVEGRDFFNDIQRPGYTPYTYPHPLTSGTQSAPSAPRNLRIVE